MRGFIRECGGRECVESPPHPEFKLRLNSDLSPRAAGLSHMAERCHEEGIVPAGAFDFAPYGCRIGVGSQNVEGEPA